MHRRQREGGGETERQRDGEITPTFSARTASHDAQRRHIGDPACILDEQRQTVRATREKPLTGQGLRMHAPPPYRSLSTSLFTQLSSGPRGRLDRTFIGTFSCKISGRWLC